MFSLNFTYSDIFMYVPTLYKRRELVPEKLDSSFNFIISFMTYFEGGGPNLQRNISLRNSSNNRLQVAKTRKKYLVFDNYYYRCTF